jgi:GTP-binding protein
LFFDRVKIYLKAGKGGNGAISFLQDKFTIRGGPDGGNGGNGGNIYFVANSAKTSLSDFVGKVHFKTKDGADGRKGNKTGKKGDDLIIEVPVGTVIKDAETGEEIVDIVKDGQKILIARGGKGGRGNASFATPTQRTPRIAEKGKKGDEREVILDLKLFADVGLLGFPNVGKSTFISVVSNAKPKIASYPFTTLQPHLGIAKLDFQREIAIADIPGLIEGAADGKGLGDKFLKHLDRTMVILHILDLSEMTGRDFIDDYIKLRKEFKNYHSNLYRKPEIIVANKVELVDSEILKSKLKEFEDKIGKEIIPISCATELNLKKVLEKLWPIVEKERKKRKYPDAPDFIDASPIKEISPIKVERKNKRFVVSGGSLALLREKFNTDSDDGLALFLKELDKLGLEKMLLKKGAKDGDVVEIDAFSIEFTFYKS